MEGLVRAAGPLDPRQLAELTMLLTTPDGASAARLQRSLRLNTTDATHLARCLQHVPPHDAAIALAAINTQRTASKPTPLVEVVCTAPFPLVVAVRATFATAAEMIAHAQREIVLVGYVFTEGARELLKRVVAASTRGVPVTLVGNQLRAHLPFLRSVWGDATPPRVFSRETDAADAMAALHAKLLLCDRTDGLVTSANFSLHGLHENIEIGVRIQAPAIARMAEVIDELIIHGEVTPLTLIAP